MLPTVAVAARQQDQGRPYTTKQTARKASSWQPARYHYPSDDEPGPVNHKRRLADESSEDDEADIDLRPAKRLHSTPPALLTEHADPQEEIKALRAHIDELHAFIQTSGVLLKAPPSIRQQIDAREDGAAALAAAIKTAISKAIEDLEPDDWQSHHDDVNGDDVSAAVLPFIEHIRGLSNFPHADSISLAMELLVYLVDSSYGELDTHVGCGNGDRPSDAPADDLFCYLARRRAKQEPSWDYTPMLKRLESVSQGPFEFGIETPFTKTVAMMRKWRMTIVID
ncbi:hypothetical protein B0A55_06750 [Friedmanniomyces simplex]|uniref:Uncharacterized protein n=1 Tax=Friedmanniomyces simplex TaxID=329884 RepID=A0A4U0X969_9PEZI|nr:hypothetical protein B0A55_06750 [Friedmanniomyces simplex]